MGAILESFSALFSTRTLQEKELLHKCASIMEPVKLTLIRPRGQCDEPPHSSSCRGIGRDLSQHINETTQSGRVFVLMICFRILVFPCLLIRCNRNVFSVLCPVLLVDALFNGHLSLRQQLEAY